MSRNRLAGIQYAGLPGISEACAEAVQKILQYGSRIASARLLTSGGAHCLLLIVDYDEIVAIKSGFSSGYRGEGPSALSRVLKLLLDHGSEVEEVEVQNVILERIDASALTEKDLNLIRSSNVIRPIRIYDYIHDAAVTFESLGTHWGRFPAVVPFAIIDRRIADLALRFSDEPNDTLLQGFRRLEDMIRNRVESKEHGAKLFAQAFQGDEAKLMWKDVQPSELNGRVNLFTGAYMAHRNPRAHQELKGSPHELLSEFLLLNHLFKLESQAILNTAAKQAEATPQPSSKQRSSRAA